jgi:hypothetical protein
MSRYCILERLEGFHSQRFMQFMNGNVRIMLI